jgi:hypothetical protein
MANIVQMEQLAHQQQIVLIPLNALREVEMGAAISALKNQAVVQTGIFVQALMSAI